MLNILAKLLKLQIGREGKAENFTLKFKPHNTLALRAQCEIDNYKLLKDLALIIEKIGT